MSYSLIVDENHFRLNSIKSNGDLQKESEVLKKGTCPMPIRTAFEANRNHAMQNGRPGRIRFCVGAFCGIPNLLEKIARVCCFTACLPCATVVSCGRENVYLMNGEVKRTMIRTMEEWRDAFNTSSALTANIIGTVSPSSTDSYVENIVGYYSKRIEDRHAHDEDFKHRVEAYRHFKELQKKAWNEGAEPPNKLDTMNTYLKRFEPSNEAK